LTRKEGLVIVNLKDRWQFIVKEKGFIMTKLISIFRLLRNIFVGLVCIAWLLPLWISSKFMLDYMEWWHEYNFSGEELFNMNVEGNYPFWPSISPIVISSYFLEIAFLLFAVAAFSLTFVIASRLWPIKGKGMN